MNDGPRFDPVGVALLCVAVCVPLWAAFIYLALVW